MSREELDRLAREVLAEGHATRGEFARALVEAIVARFDLIDKRDES